MEGIVSAKCHLDSEFSGDLAHTGIAGTWPGIAGAGKSVPQGRKPTYLQGPWGQPSPVLSGAS